MLQVLTLYIANFCASSVGLAPVTDSLGFSRYVAPDGPPFKKVEINHIVRTHQFDITPNISNYLWPQHIKTSTKLELH